MSEDLKENALPEFQKLPAILALSYLAVSALIMAYSSLFSVLPILVFLGLWFAHFYYGRQFVFRPSLGMLAMLIVPVWACYSALWSAHPFQSIYTGLEYLALILCSIVICRIVRFEHFIQGIALGVMLVLVLALVFDSNGLSSLSGGRPLIGLFGSKNQVGLMAEIGALLSVVMLFLKIPLGRKLILSAAVLALSAVCLYLSASATSILSLVVTLALLVGMFCVGRVPPLFRGLSFGALASVVLSVGAVIYMLELEVFAAVLEGFGKSSTLTGRTELWEGGIKAALEKPFLGHGYNAFWVPGNPVAEQYWSKFLIPDKTGFNFHSLFLEFFVSMGVVGLALLIGLFAILLFGGLGSILKHGMNAVNGFVFALGAMFFVRAFVEVDLLGPFGLAPLLFYSAIGYFLQPRPEEQEESS